MAFTKKWSSMGARLDPAALREAWGSPALNRARDELELLARSRGAVEEHAVARVVAAARPHVPPELRDFVCQALRLFAFNRDLGDELGRFVVRHRRSTRHRVFRAGHEIDLDVATLKERPGAHVLHPAPGIEVGGDDELPLYLLMRATSELEQGRRTANLGSSLTGCYSTFFKSAASAAFAKVDEVGKAVGLGGARGASGAGANGTGDAATYVGLLRELVGEPRADETHPKMRRVVREIADRWERGEKSLVFTFRVNTAERLHALLDAEIEQRLASKTRAIFGGERGVGGLRKRLGSTRDALYQTLLDRVLWSMLWAPPDREPPSISAAELRPTGDDYREVARLSLAFGEDILGSAPDRVFLHRAAECALARRLEDRAPRGSRCRQVLDLMADETWVERAYGGHGAEEAGEEAAVHGDADAAQGTPDEDGMGREAWNPATLEQRTGRVDRIGSRTQRLRQLGPGEDTDSVEPGTIDGSGRPDAVLGAPDARLEIDTPYLAGTYDERMFEELRIRAQTFEVLLGGELSGAGEGAPAARSDGAATDGNGSYDSEGDERAAGLVALPDSVADSLRVDLAIWRAPAPTAHDG